MPGDELIPCIPKFIPIIILIINNDILIFGLENCLVSNPLEFSGYLNFHTAQNL